jgi:hypothetical protein
LSATLAADQPATGALGRLGQGGVHDLHQLVIAYRKGWEHEFRILQQAGLVLRYGWGAAAAK